MACECVYEGERERERERENVCVCLCCTRENSEKTVLLEDLARKMERG
jgi:hypothetical protein